MTHQRTTIEGEVKRLEDEVRAFKTKQPFYDGQFTPRIGAFSNNITITTNKAQTKVDIYVTVTSTRQPNMIFEPYLQFQLEDETVLGPNKAQYLVNQQVTYEGSDTVAYIQINCDIINTPIGTPIVIRMGFITSNLTGINASRSWSVRP